MVTETTLVIFRRWRDSGDLIALFPEVPSDINGFFCEAFEHVGQHGGADYHGVVQATRSVSPEETGPLVLELSQIGYKLKSINRASRHIHERRRATARAIVNHVQTIVPPSDARSRSR